MWTSEGLHITPKPALNTRNRVTPVNAYADERHHSLKRLVKKCETPRGYLLYCRHLRLVGLVVDGLAKNVSKYSPKLWIPLLTLLSCVIAKRVVRVFHTVSFVVSQTPNNQSSVEVNQSGVFPSMVEIAIFLFPLLNIFYEVAIWVIFFGKRQEFANISEELLQLSRRVQNSDTIGVKVIKRGRKYLCLITIWYLCECTWHYYGKIWPLHGILRWDEILVETLLTNVILIHKVIASMAVEGMVIFFLRYFNECLRNFNETLKQLGEQEEESLRKRIGEHRLLFGQFHCLFGKVKKSMSTALAYSFTINIISIMSFVVIFRKYDPDDVFENNEGTFQIIVNVLRICVICWYSGIISDEVSQSFQILSIYKLNEESSSKWEINQEILMFSSQTASSSFQFTAAGFCEIRKPLLPTIVGVLITYTVLLIQNDSSC